MRAESPLAIHVHYEEGVVSLSGAIQQQSRISAESMLHSLLERTSQRSIDLLSIAAGVYAIDRVSKRVCGEQNECGIRTLRVVFDVSDYTYWTQDVITNQLTELLCFLTGDTWLISFNRQPRSHRSASNQRPLQFEGPHPSRVGLYSGGLDSAAGFAKRLCDHDQTHMLLTVGHQSAIRLNCVGQLRTLKGLLTQAPAFYHASFMVRFDKGVAGKMRDQEQSQRARGFLFCAAAGITADACGIEVVELFENGVGAINLPLTEGGLIDGLTTRGAHPGFLDKMSRLLSSVFEKPLSFTLPFLQQTKAEMVRSLVPFPHMITWAQRSRSCVHTSLRVARKRHCGRCPACIERRQAFKAADAQEDVSDYQHDLFNDEGPADPSYILCYLENARWWLASDPDVRTRLERHRILSKIEHLPQESMEDLYKRHAAEAQLTYGDLTLREPTQRPQTPKLQLDLA